MSRRLDKARQERLEPTRISRCIETLQDIGFSPTISGKAIIFIYKGEAITFWPYSGWHSGKSIKDGRGFENLLKQIFPKP